MKHFLDRLERIHKVQGRNLRIRNQFFPERRIDFEKNSFIKKEEKHSFLNLFRRNRYMSQKIALVAGASGLIGKYLLEELSKSSYYQKVLCSCSKTWKYYGGRSNYFRLRIISCILSSQRNHRRFLLFGNYNFQSGKPGKF